MLSIESLLSVLTSSFSGLLPKTTPLNELLKYDTFCISDIEEWFK